MEKVLTVPSLSFKVLEIVSASKQKFTFAIRKTKAYKKSSI